MGKELLIDTVSMRLMLEESADGTNKLVAKGEFARGEVPTANKRIYPTKLWLREVSRLKESMKARKVYGELDHPEDGKTKLGRSSHIISDMVVTEDGIVIGKAEIMETDAGKNLKAILDAGGAVGISSRGFGSVKMHEDGMHNVVQEDYKLLTFDFVADPAQETAYPAFGGGAAAKKESVMSEDNANVIENVPTPAQPEAAAQPLQEGIGTQIPDGMSEQEVIDLFFKGGLIKTADLDQRISALESQHQEALNKVLTEKNDLIEGLKVEKDGVLTGLQKEVETLRAENAEYNRICRDLGFNLFIERALGKHPKYKEISEGLKFDSFATLADLKKAIEPHIAEVAALPSQTAQLESVQAELVKANESVVAAQGETAKVKEEAEQLKSQLKIAVEEKEMAVKVGLESAARAYLERKIVGNPSASKIRTQFESLDVKTKVQVDAIIEAHTQSATSKRDSLHESVRRRVRGSQGSLTEGASQDANQPSGRKLPPLVEQSLKGTVKEQGESGESVKLTEDFSMDLRELNKLAGLSRQV